MLCMANDANQIALDEAAAAVRYAQMVRAKHRRRTERGTREREEDIRLALERLKAAMKPLRSEIGRFAYGPPTPGEAPYRQSVRESSDAIQRERRKLWKMRKR